MRDNDGDQLEVMIKWEKGGGVWIGKLGHVLVSANQLLQERERRESGG